MTDDKQTAAMRKAFESLFKSYPEYQQRTFDYFAKDADGEYVNASIYCAFEGWKFGILAERERCAKVCDAVEERHDDSKEFTALCFEDGKAEGAYVCAALIRAGEALEGGT